jgi:tocopherol O-methyltransferase
MKRFTNKDIENYYDQTEVHYRMHWKLDEGMGLHYGVWDENTKNLAEAVLNSNYRLMNLGEIKPTDYVLDAGCGIGGSSIYLAKNKGCRVQGITLSEKQVKTATDLAAKKGVGDKVTFSQQDYTSTNFPDNTFDIAWCIESMETATDKTLFFDEMKRILKPGGKILVADIFKPQGYDMSKEKDMQVMLNGWAMSDILSIDELHTTAEKSSFKVTKIDDVSKNVLRSVNKMYFASILGAVGTTAYNMVYNASYFSKIHYKTGFAQKKAYHQNKWGYYLICIENRK